MHTYQFFPKNVTITGCKFPVLLLEKSLTY